jgi:hypothetical protein
MFYKEKNHEYWLGSDHLAICRHAAEHEYLTRSAISTVFSCAKNEGDL